MKVIIAGSRSFDDYNFLRAKCDKALSSQTEVEIISGTANGADRLGEKYADEKGYAIKRFPADWDKYGKKSGYIRNEEMAKYSDALICFWDGTSMGSKSMIDLANKYKLKVKVYIWQK